MFFLIFLQGTIIQKDSLCCLKSTINFVYSHFPCLFILSPQSIFYHLDVTLIFIVTHFTEFYRQNMLSYQKQNQIIYFKKYSIYHPNKI